MQYLKIPFNKAFDIVNKIPLYPYKNYNELHNKIFNYDTLENIIDLINNNNVKNEEAGANILRINVMAINIKVILELLAIKYDNIIINNNHKEDIEVYFTFDNIYYTEPILNSNNFIIKGTKTLGYLKDYKYFKFQSFIEHIPFIIISNEYISQLLFNTTYYQYSNIPKELLNYKKIFNELTIDEYCIELGYYINSKIKKILKIALRRGIFVKGTTYAEVDNIKTKIVEYESGA